MPIRVALLALLCALLLAPAAASAQSAGDEQYEDPFGDATPQAQATPAPAQAPSAAPAQAPATPAPAAPASASAPAATSASAPGQLPRTGGDAWIPALLGLGLLSAGVALRARARRVT
jgi:LPXTG-motif cell wall-anchored protein